MMVSLFTDGGARGNPGPAGAGVHIQTGTKDYTYGLYLGERTNNQAEYLALTLGLEYLIELEEIDVQSMSIEVFLDSELVVKQLNGEYKVRDAGLLPYYNAVKGLEASFPMIKFIHIPRIKNVVADRAVNKVLDLQYGITKSSQKST
jgi:ribonuclease HI